MSQTNVTFSAVQLDELRHLVSERALTGETMLLNMGPQHPSTHGVLRLLLELDGETGGQLHPRYWLSAHRHREEHGSQDLLKAEVMTDRLDYLNTMGNNLAYCLAVEKLVRSGCARPRAGRSA